MEVHRPVGPNVAFGPRRKKQDRCHYQTRFLGSRYIKMSLRPGLRQGPVGAFTPLTRHPGWIWWFASRWREMTRVIGMHHIIAV